MEQTKRIYVAPAMQVVELKARQMLLVGSTRNGGIDDISKQDLDYEDD